ncbi:MAG: hypothetical protein QNJ45_10455, partial [Ardenticatenaceae bacterium]|nr:hypothetical protein [Ardenticatenaceae bacterium]
AIFPQPNKFGRYENRNAINRVKNRIYPVSVSMADGFIHRLRKGAARSKVKKTSVTQHLSGLQKCYKKNRPQITQILFCNLRKSS